MIKKQKICIVLSICLILLLPGIVLSEENKKDSKSSGSEKVQIEKTVKLQAAFNLSEKKPKYSMYIIKPNLDIDSGIINNNFDASIDYKLRIINPYTGEQVTGTRQLLEKGLFNRYKENLSEEKLSKPVLNIKAKAVD